MASNLVESKLLVADEAWCALASLHRDYPARRGFTAKEILERAAQRSTSPLRPGVQVHIYQHNVANVPATSGRYRMFFRLPDGTFRLYLPGDICDPLRKGKTKPDWEDLPANDRPLLEFYDREFRSRHTEPNPEDDPLVSLRGSGKKLWEDAGGADQYIRQERIAWENQSSADATNGNDEMEDVWRRIVACEGQEFETTTGLPFTYIVDAQGLWPVRNGKRINMKLSRGEIGNAIRKGRPEKVADLNKKFRDPSYLFSLLRDGRTAPRSWRRG
ncbi:MAG: hypothetical protein U0R19_19840 [Bryobacteraceae bacterium]